MKRLSDILAESLARDYWQERIADVLAVAVMIFGIDAIVFAAFCAWETWRLP